jgi:o-succinylbenzoate synthase
MLIDGLTIREIHLRLKAPFETSFATLLERRILLVEAHAEGLTGWGEITAGEGPFYNPEAVDPSWIIFREFVAPMVVGKNVSASDLPALLEPLRGYEMTKAAVENAIWDIEAQQVGKPLAEILGGTQKEIACGVSLGIRGTAAELLKAIETELAAGYQRIKIKIKPGKDLEFISTTRKKFPKMKLMADANSAYRLEDADLLKKFDEYDLMMIEQPLDWDEIYQHSKLQKLLKTPICLDECIHNLRHAQAAVELGACRIINIKLGRVGGHSEAKRIQAYCREKSIPVWCGGMLESGIGRAHNIAMSALPGFVLPGDVSASSRYWDEDVIEPEVKVSSHGTIEVPKTPGLGYRVRRKRVEQLTARQETFRSKGRNVAVPESAA